MRIPRVFVDISLAAATVATLAPDATHYIRNVLRLRERDSIVLFNGTGGEFHGHIAALRKSSAEVEIDAFIEANRESSLRIDAGLCIVKRDAMDAAIRKATELGVSSITPILSDFVSVSRKAIEGRREHWTQIVRSACEQCERNRLPELREVSPLKEWVSGTTSETRLVAHPGAETSVMTLAAEPASVALLIGPEGGLSDDELGTASASDFIAISLGPRILRAETAPIALLAQIQGRWGDLN